MLVSMYLLLGLLLMVRFGVLLKSMEMLAWSVAVLLCLFLLFCKLSSVLTGVPILALQAYWPCHLGVDNLHVAMTICRLSLCP